MIDRSIRGVQSAPPDAFTRAVRHTLEAEGIFSNHSWDPGGKTKYGITDRLARKYGHDVEKLTVTQATHIYRVEFWERLQLDTIAAFSWRVAAEMFDTAVNCGTDRAVRIVQEALAAIFEEGVEVDGKLGPRTIDAIRRVAGKYEDHFLAALNGFQFTFYLSLLRQGHPAARPAIKGWMRRLVTPKS